MKLKQFLSACAIVILCFMQISPGFAQTKFGLMGLNSAPSPRAGILLLGLHPDFNLRFARLDVRGKRMTNIKGQDRTFVVSPIISQGVKSGKFDTAYSLYTLPPGRYQLISAASKTKISTEKNYTVCLAGIGPTFEIRPDIINYPGEFFIIERPEKKTFGVATPATLGPEYAELDVLEIKGHDRFRYAHRYDDAAAVSFSRIFPRLTAPLHRITVTNKPFKKPSIFFSSKGC